MVSSTSPREAVKIFLAYVLSGIRVMRPKGGLYKINASKIDCVFVYYFVCACVCVICVFLCCFFFTAFSFSTLILLVGSFDL